LALQIRSAVRKLVGVPVCVGIAPTKVLAKLSNRHAKETQPHSAGVFVMPPNPELRLPILQAIPVEKVWGIAAGLSSRLIKFGIRSAAGLGLANTLLIRKLGGVVLQRIALELRGLPCIELDDYPAPRKSILSSRSFGSLVYNLPPLEEAVCSYTSRAAEKLRAQRSVCFAIEVFITTNPYRKNLPQYRNSSIEHLPEPASDTPTLCAAARRALARIWHEGFAYHKAGVILWGILPAAALNLPLFPPAISNRTKRDALMAALDTINRKFGRGTIRIASSGIQQTWQMRRTQRSPRYTTCWEELPIVSAKPYPTHPSRLPSKTLSPPK
ncbi:MAG: DUF4113 domain-containing protein, partial [Chthoniobacterales bacterium]|nr:DUF4113 domain-containing protein [Chthoniobacterales bacterium]